MANFMRMDERGEFVAAPVGDPKSVAADAALLARAAKFAEQLVK
jgi:hypothetical protein